MDEILQNSYFRTINKDKYSFPKSSRFPELKPSCTIDYYDSSSLKKTRSTSFGYGSKFDFFKQSSKGPGPFDYKIDNLYRQTRGASFGRSREDIKIHNYIDPEKIKTPRVGAYNADSLSTKKKGLSYSLVGKHPSDSFIQPDQNPSPHKYNPVDTFYSRRKRSAQFGFGSSERFDYDTKQVNRMVGPGSYVNSPPHQPKHGKIPLAERKTYAVEEIEKSISPGPKYLLK